MAESNSKQHWIGRNRAPRVQITYDVEIGDAMEVKELPFIVGILGDLAGHSSQPKLKERKFVQVDGDNFDDVLAGYSPSLSFTVANKLDDSSENIPVELSFDRLADFGPMAVIGKVDKLRETYERRNALNALLAKIYVNDDLASALNEVIRSAGSDEELQKKLEELKSKL